MGGHPMDERGLRGLIDQVRAGRVSRRAFVKRMAAAGLTAPMATQLLAFSGVAMAQSKAPVYKPTKRGGGGLLKVLWWQGPTLLNPHFATGTKDQGLEIERPQMPHAAGEEAVLLADDFGGHLENGVGALFQRAHQPAEHSSHGRIV